MTKPKRIDPRRAESFDLIFPCLPGTKLEITQRSGLSRTTVYAAVAQLRKLKKIRVASWVKHPVRGPSVPVLALGSEPDAIDRIPRLTRKQSQDRYQKNLVGTEKHDVLKAKWRTRHWMQKAANKPNTWLSALGLS